MSTDDEKPDEKKIVNLADAKKRLEATRQKKEAVSKAEAPGGSAPADDELLALAKANAAYFHDDGEPYASVKVSGGHREVIKLRSGDYRAWLDHLYYREYRSIPKAAKRKDALAVLEGLARFDGADQRVHVRVAEHDGVTYLDLGNARREIVRIDDEGWSLVSESPIRLRRPKGMRPIPRPERGGNLDELRPFVNLGEHGYRLFVAWLVGALRARGPYPILVIQGEQGAGKSTTARIAKRLLDEAKAPLRSMSRTERDLAVATMNSWIPAFDNLSARRTTGLAPDVSDALCRISTGGGVSARKLYTDDDEVILEFVRPVIINGIDDLAVRPDLAERALVVVPETIKPSQRKDERTLWAEFDAVAPRILGVLLDGVASALARYPTVTVPELPRMADFARWVTAAEPGLGWSPGTFIGTYRHHREQSNREAMDRDAVASLIPKLPQVRAAGTGTWTPSALFRALTALADESSKRGTEWPGAANSLSAHLRRIAPILRANGYDVTFDRDAAQRTINISRKPSSPSSPSPEGGEPTSHDEDDGHDDG